MKNKLNKKYLKNKADKLWFRLYLKPDCEVCGKPAIQCHHFYYKRNYPHLRYDKDNAISLCRACHFVLHHQDPHLIEDTIIARKGLKWHKLLQKRAYKRPVGTFLTAQYYEDIIKQLECKPIRKNQ